MEKKWRVVTGFLLCLFVVIGLIWWVKKEAKDQAPVIQEAVVLLKKIEPFLAMRDYLLGNRSGGTKIVVLLLNDKELRTNGGFMGSYAVVEMKDGKPTWRFQDIYVPDGQLPGYVAPPAPVQEAFKTGSHRLPNADWSPDFPKTAAAIRWFFDKGGEIEPDILITLNLATVQQVLKIVGEVEVGEYQIKLNEENVYDWLQNEAEIDFFPGSTQKKDAISALGKALVNKIENLDWKTKIELAKLLIDDLEKKNVVVNSLDENFEEILRAKGWAGEYSPIPHFVTTGIVEINLGANKANCCIERKTKYKITESKNNLIHSIELRLKNNSPFEFPVKPLFYGGNYLSYLRFYLPVEAENIQVQAWPSEINSLETWPEPYDGVKGKINIDQVYGFKEVGFFHLTKAGTESSVLVNYQIPDKKTSEFWLAILKQHGLREAEHEIEILGQKVNSTMQEDFLMKFDRN